MTLGDSLGSIVNLCFKNVSNLYHKSVTLLKKLSDQNKDKILLSMGEKKEKKKKSSKPLLNFLMRASVPCPGPQLCRNRMSLLFFFFLLIDRESDYIAQAVFEFLPLESWNYRHAPSHLTRMSLL